MSTASDAERRRHERLCAYLLGELQGEERRAVEAEIAASPELREERARLEATIGLVRSSFPEARLSEAAQAELIQAAEARRAPHSVLVPWHRSPMVRVAAGFLALLGGATLVWRGVSREGDLQVARQAPAGYEQRELAQRDRDGNERAVLDRLESLGYDGGPPRTQEALKSLGYVASGEDDGVSTRIHDGPARSFEVPEEEGGLPAAVPEPKSEIPRNATMAPVKDAEALAKASHRGPGDTVPPGGADTGLATTGSDAWFLGRAKREAPAAAGPASPGIPQGEGALLRSIGYADAGDAEPEVFAELEVLGYGGGGGAAPPARDGDDEDRLALLDGRKEAGKAGVDGPAEPGEEQAAGRFGGRFGRGRAQHVLRPPEVVADELIGACMRRPNEPARAMFHRFWGEHPFEPTASDALSTFAADVDTASYALARRYLRAGHLPPPEAVRTEEFVNWFRPDAPPPADPDDTFAVQMELAPSLFGADDGLWMLRVAVRGREVDEFDRQPLALTFVVDVSGSMSDGARLRLVVDALRELAAKLSHGDSLALVTFSKEARLVLPTTPATQRGAFEEALALLVPKGGTNVDAGLALGYRTAAEAFTPDAVNRVVLLSDGVANVGETDRASILERVREQRELGIWLNTVGVGMGNHDDAFLEELADKGDGVCHYIDDAAEARRALVDGFVGAFEPIARDVKIQVALDPDQVVEWRQLGYENRAVADADFRNDAVDAGEVNAGHQVSALYELRLSGARSGAPLVTTRVRWLPPFGEEGGARELEATLGAGGLAPGFEAGTAGYRRSVLVAQLAEVLRDSVHARGDSWPELVRRARALAEETRDPELEELDQLLALAQPLLAPRLEAAPDELRAALDELRRLRYLQARLDVLRESHASAGGESADEAAWEEEIGALEARVRVLVEESSQERLRALGY